MRSVLSSLVVALALGCSGTPPVSDVEIPSDTGQIHPRAEQLGEECAQIVDDALEYYAEWPCQEDAAEQARIFDSKQIVTWERLKGALCDRHNLSEQHQWLLGEFERLGCLPLPIPVYSIGSDFEPYLCWTEDVKQ